MNRFQASRISQTPCKSMCSSLKKMLNPLAKHYTEALQSKANS
jgi:hypothetical protein